MMGDEDAKRLMIDCLMDGIRAVHPEACLEQHLPDLSGLSANGKVYLLAGGKGAGAMMKVAVRYCLRHIDKTRICGVAVGKPDGYVPMFHMSWMEAGHPVPDVGSVKGANRVLQMAKAAGADDLVIVLLSGGASALWSAPVQGVSLVQKQQLTRDLLRSGAAINEINCVRKHLSKIKGGRLARAVAPARLATFAISDVVEDDLATIASGPVSPDPSRLDEASKVLAKYHIRAPSTIMVALFDPANETPKPGAYLLANNDFQIVANGASALNTAASKLGQQGVEVINLGDCIEGEARDVAREHAHMALRYVGKKRPVALLSGGELTVTIRGAGWGGPNQEYALALALALEGEKAIYGLAADTDGCDGGRGLSTDSAGALVFPSTLLRARAQKLNPATFLADNNSGAFFKKLGDLLVTGPTHTNVNDFRLVLIDNK